jgi:hypothetical protein
MKIQSAAKINNTPVILIDGNTYSVATIKTVTAAAEAAPADADYSIEVKPFVAPTPAPAVAAKS